MSQKNHNDHRTWDNPGSTPLHPPAEILDRLRARERGAARALRTTTDLSIPMLVGRIGVGVIFVDSTEAAFQIRDDEHAQALAKIDEGLQLLASFEPRAGIEWKLDIHRPRISAPIEAFPPEAPESWEDRWRDPAMEAIGQEPSLRGMNAYLQSLKERFDAAWSFAIYVTKYPKPWFAYHWGNHLIVDFRANVWGIENLHLIVAHETAHIFGCSDEYAGSNCSCTDLFGQLRIPNGNCEACAPTSVPCLMKGNTPTVCDYTRGHLGWSELGILRKGTVSLKKGRALDLETGVVPPIPGLPGMDLLWEHLTETTRRLTPLNGAGLASMGAADFDIVSFQRLDALPFSAASLDGSDSPANALPVGTVLGVRTSAGRLAKLRVTAIGPTLGLEYVTYQ